MKQTLNDVWEVTWAKKFSFFGVFFVIFFCTYLLLVIVDFLPEPPNQVVKDETSADMESNDSETADESADQAAGSSVIEPTDEVTPAVVSFSTPTQLTIPSIDLSINIENPSSRLIADLDAALLGGVVRHPDSALLGQPGTVFILGHSSYLPVVRNRNFQALNGIQNLAWGDTIELSSEAGTYVYRVDRVYKAVAQEVVVPIAGDVERLVLATCNSFGSVDDRHIVEAELLTVRKNT